MASIEIDAPARHGALYVVDGQQRLTTLANVLLADERRPIPPRYDLYFDLERQAVDRPSREEPVPVAWIPIRVARDMGRVFDWLDAEPERRRNDLWVRRARELTTRITGYKVPAYIVEAASDAPLRQVFHRLNTTGRPMREDEVFQALFGDRETKRGLPALSDAIAVEGVGVPTTRELVQVVKAIEGLDVTRKFDRQSGGVRALETTARTGVEPLRRALAFLRDEAGVPHLRLLPHHLALVVLARFFHFHPSPADRNRLLLVRWLWRGSVTGALAGSNRTLTRRMVGAIDGHEHETVQRLLALVGRPAGGEHDLHPFDARKAWSRLEALALVKLRPRHLDTGAYVDLAAAFEEHDLRALPQLYTAQQVPEDARPLLRTLANRVVHPPFEAGASVMARLEEIARDARDANELLASDRFPPDTVTALERHKIDVLTIAASHGFPPDAVAALARGERSASLRMRASFLRQRVNEELARRMALDYSDHPPLHALDLDEEPGEAA